MNGKLISLKWRKVPKNIREKILSNVFCSNCKCAVKVVDYSIEEDKIGLIIKGKCEACDGIVVRVVEN